MVHVLFWYVVDVMELMMMKRERCITIYPPVGVRYGSRVLDHIDLDLRTEVSLCKKVVQKRVCKLKIPIIYFRVQRWMTGDLR